MYNLQCTCLPSLALNLKLFLAAVLSCCPAFPKIPNLSCAPTSITLWPQRLLGPNPSWATPSPTYPAPPFLCFLLVLCFPLPLHHSAKTSIEAVQNVLYCPWPSALLRRKWYSASFLSSKGVKHGRERAGIKSPLEKKDKMLHCCSLHQYLSHTGTHFVYRVSLIENSVLVRLHYCQLMH